MSLVVCAIGTSCAPFMAGRTRAGTEPVSPGPLRAVQEVSSQRHQLQEELSTLKRWMVEQREEQAWMVSTLVTQEN